MPFTSIRPFQARVRVYTDTRKSGVARGLSSRRIRVDVSVTELRLESALRAPFIKIENEMASI